MAHFCLTVWEGMARKTGEAAAETFGLSSRVLEEVGTSSTVPYIHLTLPTLCSG